MKRKNRIIYLLLILICILVGGIYAYTEFNRKPENTANLSASFKLSADEILSNFSSDSKNSNLKYLNKVLEISGKVASLENQSGNTLVLAGKTSGISIRCSMDSSFDKQSKLNSGTTITIRGIYTGFNEDDLGLGSDILINKAIIIP